MERAAYRYLEAGERSWWYRGRWWGAEKALTHTHIPTGSVLDFGAGRGASRAFLGSYGAVDAFEVDAESAAVCKARGYRHVFSKMPPETDQYALIAAFDVIEHIEDDSAALSQLHARLQQDGVIVITVPAYRWLWSAHDELHQHFRRYDRRDICSVLAKAGFTIEYASYWNMTLMPVAYIMRKMGKGGGESLTPAPFVDRILSMLVWLESHLLSLVPLPFGTGIVVVGRK